MIRQTATPSDGLHWSLKTQCSASPPRSGSLPLLSVPHWLEAGQSDESVITGIKYTAVSKPPSPRKIIKKKSFNNGSAGWYTNTKEGLFFSIRWLQVFHRQYYYYYYYYGVSLFSHFSVWASVTCCDDDSSHLAVGVSLQKSPLMRFTDSRFPAQPDTVAVVSLFPDAINFINADNAVRAGPDETFSSALPPPITFNASIIIIQ